jgi:tetratricopeptide (TPR) repeat protein
MVGRDDELAITDAALRAARAGYGSVMFVVGEGGIGKSRLAAAAADLAFAADMRLLRGRGSAVGPTMPFRSLTEALLSLLRSHESIDVRELGPYLPVLARLIPDLGPPSSGEEGGSLVVMAEAVLRLTGLAGRERGCLIILDDLQDADAETMAVVDYLAGNLAGQPAMLIGTIRDEPCLAMDVAKSAVQRGDGILVELARLGADDMRWLAASCLGTDGAAVPDEVADHLWTASEGNPLLAEEMLNGLLSSGQLARAEDCWRTTRPLRVRPSITLTRTTAEQLERVSSQGRELLSVAAILGRRFPIAVVQAATGIGQLELLSLLHADVAAQLVAPDDETPDWYAFQHPLLSEALLALLSSGERERLTRQTVAAVTTAYPGLPGEWCQVSAALHLQVGDRGQAGRLFAEAARRALAQGAANSAVTLLDKALSLFDPAEDARDRADAFASLLYALAEAGLVERAVTYAGELDSFAGLLTRSARGQLHTRLAWAAAVAGRSAEGMAQVEIARRLLGPDATAGEIAPVDVVAAHLALDVPGARQVQEAEKLGRRAAAAAEEAQLPVVACQAWQLLGALTRSRDPDEATACLERARRIAVVNDLSIENIHVLIRLGNDDALRNGSLGRLHQARLDASRVGAVTSRYQAEASLALQMILRGDFAEAEELIEQVLAATSRLGLLETIWYTLLLRAILGAHRGRRSEMDAALAELHRWEGDHPQHAPRVLGLARAWCALLEENRPLASRELGLALAAEEASPTVFQLTGRYGLHLLLRAMDGTLDLAEYHEITAAPVGRLRWDRQFAQFAEALLAGRGGRPREAAEAAAAAVRTGGPYRTGRHLGLRLVSEAAVADGWGAPVEWLRAAEGYFHEREVTAVASACRAMLRRAGVTVAQRRQGAENIPPGLRAAGVTVREYEILQLLTERLSNREIGLRLHLSPRTVEKHVASLIVKTGQADRITLGEFGSAALRTITRSGQAASGNLRAAARWVQGPPPGTSQRFQVLSKETLDRRVVDLTVLRLHQAMPFVGEQKVLMRQALGLQGGDDLLSLVSGDPHVVSPLCHQDGNADVVDPGERGPVPQHVALCLRVPYVGEHERQHGAPIRRPMREQGQQIRRTAQVDRAAERIRGECRACQGRIAPVGAAHDGDPGGVDGAVSREMSYRVEQVGMHRASPLLGTEVPEPLAVARRAAEVDLDARVAAAGQPLPLLVQVERVTGPGAPVHVHHGRERAAVGLGRPGDVAVHGDSVPRAERERFHPGKPVAPEPRQVTEEELQSAFGLVVDVVPGRGVG